MAERNAGMMAAMLICGLIVVSLLLSMSAAGALAAPTVTPKNNTATPTPTPVPTPVPTPAPREVFTTVSWDADHASVQVSNNGPAIEVEAYIGSLSNKTTTHVGAGISTKVPTMTISATSGQIIRCWFKAYENGTLIDSMEVPVTVSTAATPTPGPETAIVTGKVVDASTGTAISGAEISFVPKDFERNYPGTITDSSGTFTTVARMSPGTYYLTIKASGYEQKTVMIPVGEGPQQINQPITMARSPQSSPTATPTITPSSPTPGSPMDAWMNLLYSPQACCGTLAVALGAIVSATAIYEWTMRQRERRKREAKESPKGTEGTKDSKDSK